MNIDQIKMDLCRQQAVIELIERSAQKAKYIACSDWYGLFSSHNMREADIKKQNNVTERLVNYLRTLKAREDRSWI